jgi:peptidoglycan/xylan/chitin deacetylase (PgdA/CDA1 family)
VTVALTFDNLGEVADLGRGTWPDGEPLGEHFSVTRVLPRLRALLDETGARATFFVEGRNAELYPDALRELVADGHEIGCHGWCHEVWGDLAAGAEARLLERAREALAAIGVPVHGFRPPGGRLTASTLRLLREHGFTHASPAGSGAGVRDGIALVPFRWPLVDAYHVLPRFAGLRARDRGAPGELPPAVLRDAIRAAVEAGGVTTLVFHPFLLAEEARLGVLRDALAALGTAAVPLSVVADGLLRDGGGTGEALHLDATVA